MVGILISFWDGLFSGAMLVSGSVLSCLNLSEAFQPTKTLRLAKQPILGIPQRDQQLIGR